MAMSVSVELQDVVDAMAKYKAMLQSGQVDYQVQSTYFDIRGVYSIALHQAVRQAKTDKDALMQRYRKGEMGAAKRPLVEELDPLNDALFAAQQACMDFDAEYPRGEMLGAGPRGGRRSREPSSSRDPSPSSSPREPPPKVTLPKDLLAVPVWKGGPRYGDSLTAEQMVQKVEYLATFGKWTDETKIGALVSKFQGAADDWWQLFRARPDTCKIEKDWDRLTMLLVTHFKDQEHPDSGAMLAADMTQKEGEKVTAWYVRCGTFQMQKDKQWPAAMKAAMAAILPQVVAQALAALTAAEDHFEDIYC